MAIEAQRPSTFQRICDYEGRLEFRVPVHRRALLAALALAALVSAVVAVVAVAIQTGALADLYEWLWMNTTGETYTDVMRDHSRVYPTVAAAVITPAAFLLPRQYWVRIVLLYVTFWTSFVGGHVFW